MLRTLTIVKKKFIIFVLDIIIIVMALFFALYIMDIYFPLEIFRKVRNIIDTPLFLTIYATIIAISKNIAEYYISTIFYESDPQNNILIKLTKGIKKILILLLIIFFLTTFYRIFRLIIF